MSLTELLSPGRAQAARNRIYGVVVGIVRDIKDPQNLGRVKVDFPWLSEAADAVSVSSDDDRAHSYWARVATLMAGKGRGVYFVPEVGDEVLVAFEHGDLNRPYVLGVLWNADDTPPVAMDAGGKNDVRAIYSRSGHKIVLDDSDDKPSIQIVDKTGNNSIVIDSANNAMQIKIDGDLSIEVKGNISIKTDGKFETSAKQAISTKTDADLKLEAAGGAKMEASSNVEIKGSAGLKLESTGQTEVKGTTVSVNGSAMTEVKGGLVKIN